MRTLYLDYLAFPPKSGIYTITHRGDGKVYVGSAANMRTRRRKHHLSLMSGTHHSRHLQAAWNKYGAEAFEFAVVEFSDRENLIALEQAHIDARNAASRDHGYNVLPTAHSFLGRRNTEEQLQRCREAAKKRPPVTAATRELLASLRRGVKRDPAIGLKTAASQRGRTVSMEQRAQIAATLRGRTHSEETKAKIALAGLNRRRSFESIARSAAAHRGMKRSDETRARISAAGMGRKASDVARERMAEGQRKRWAAARAAA